MSLLEIFEVIVAGGLTFIIVLMVILMAYLAIDEIRYWKNRRL